MGQQDIVLDCNYHFDSHEAEQLEVKWYFNKVLTFFALFAPDEHHQKLFRIQRPSFNGSPASLGASLRYSQDFVLQVHQEVKATLSLAENSSIPGLID